MTDRAVTEQLGDRRTLERSAFPSMTTGRWALTGLAVVLAALIPLVLSSQYYLSVMVTTLILLVLNISWNFVLGVAGVWNFGQLAIYALGGYGAGIIMLHSSVSPWLALLAGGVVGTIAAVLLAFPTLRLYGIYTSLLTFASAYAGTGDAMPMTVALNNVVNTSTGVVEYNVNMAAAMIAALPTLIVYVVAGRYFVRGLMAGAVKG